MPFVKILRGRDGITSMQKQRLLQGVLEAVVAVEGEAMRTGIGVALDESVVSPDLLLNCVSFVTLTVIRGALTAEQRQQMLQGVVEAVIAVEGEEHRTAVWAVLEESVADGEWSIGGNKLTMEAMKHIKRGENPWPDPGASA